MEINLNSLHRDISEETCEAFVEEYPEVQTWLEGKAENTKPKYIRCLIRYAEILHSNGIIKTPDSNGLLELARQSTREEMKHVQALLNFQKACDKVLPEEQRAIVYQISIAVKSFYNQFNYTFPRFKGTYDYSPQEKEKIPRLEEVQNYIDCVKHIRTKMLIALESSTAIRMGSLCKLKWSHFRELLETYGKTFRPEQKEEIAKQRIPSIRLKDYELKGAGVERYRGTVQICFLTPLAKDFILRYKVWYEKVTGKTVTLENAEELPREVKTVAILDFLQKAMDFYDLDWRDFTKALLGKNCILCGSRIRKDPSCSKAVSVGTRNCLYCGASLEKIEIEPSYSKA